MGAGQWVAGETLSSWCGPPAGELGREDPHLCLKRWLPTPPQAPPLAPGHQNSIPRAGKRGVVCARPQSFGTSPLTPGMRPFHSQVQCTSVESRGQRWGPGQAHRWIGIQGGKTWQVQPRGVALGDLSPGRNGYGGQAGLIPRGPQWGRAWSVSRSCQLLLAMSVGGMVTSGACMHAS